MNWYKILKFCQQVLEKPLTYFDIGHEIVTNKERSGSPNFMWIFYDGEVLAIEESEENVTHEEAFPFIGQGSWPRYYSGRYESGTGRLSLLKPVQGVAAHRDVPGVLINRLYQEFPEITEIKPF